MAGRKAIAEHQRRRFNELVDIFDRPQSPDVMARLREIVASAGLRPGSAVLDVGTGVGVLIPLIQSYQPSTVLACDVAEKMLQRVRDKYPVRPTSRHHLRTAAFTVGGHDYQAIEQNPDKPSRWGQLARSGRQVVQFKDVERNEFVAVVVDGEVTYYGASKKRS